MRRLYLDCDGVLADFDKGATAVLGLPPRAFEQRHGLGRFWQRLAISPDFYFERWEEVGGVFVHHTSARESLAQLGEYFPLQTRARLGEQ